MSVATLRAKHAAQQAVFTERSRRRWAATEARALGYGGIAAVARATGLSPATISRGLLESDAEAALPVDRVRKPGGGRKRATTHHPTLLRDLEALVEPTAPGDPESPLRWTCLSTRTLAVALEALSYAVSHTVVAELLHGLGYSLQGNVKTREGRQHPDRDAQFRYIARQVQAAQPGRGHRHRCTDGDDTPRTASVPWRLELHHPPGYRTIRSHSCFRTAPNVRDEPRRASVSSATSAPLRG